MVYADTCSIFVLDQLHLLFVISIFHVSALIFVEIFSHSLYISCIQSIACTKHLYLACSSDESFDNVVLHRVMHIGEIYVRCYDFDLMNE